MPQLKRVQQENMRKQVQKIIFQLKQDICRMLATEWLGGQTTSDQDQGKISQQVYDDKISRVKTQYLKMWQVIQKLNGKLGLAASDDHETQVIYDDLTTELKFKLLNGFQEVNFKVDDSVGLHSS